MSWNLEFVLRDFSQVWSLKILFACFLQKVKSCRAAAKAFWYVCR